MKLSEVKEILDAEVLVGEHNLDREVYLACGSDLMSDVLAFVKDKVLLLTGLVNPQVIRTAEMMDIKAIVFVRGKKPSEEILKLAEEKDMIILTTKYPLYISCGLLYSKGLTGQESKQEGGHET
ncbi:DRTGG domain-containing protein [Defluviitalea phaphyphila]|uniref:DRTGG domain-containing protein n=1 Tax=Defluviitalea phaphyphila TaxID=1473580 RepID=UPI000730A70D|nr:DRTGG domain-containing protein [Defluviitalea phaphyphila]